MTTRYCTGHREHLPLSSFNGSAEAARSNLCADCVNERRRARYRDDPVTALVAESRKKTGLNVTRSLYDTVTRLHSNRCWISGAAWQPLVLLRVDQFPGAHEKAELCFVPVLRKYSHTICLEGKYRDRFEVSLQLRDISNLRKQQVDAPSVKTPPPATNTTPTTTPPAGLVRKGTQKELPIKVTEMYLVQKAGELGVDPVSIYRSLLMLRAKNGRL